MDWTLIAVIALVALLVVIAVVAMTRWLSLRSKTRATPTPTPSTNLRNLGHAGAVVDWDEADDPGTAPVVMNQLFRHALGRSGPEALDAQLHASIEQATVAALRDIAQNPRYLPRRPQLLPQLLQAVNDDESSLRDIARIISQDPALTGNLLRIANSPAYRVQPEPVESIERAVALLGTMGIRSTIAAAVLQPVLSSGGAFGQFPETIWNHTLLAAIASEAHAVLVGDDDPFAAQLAGLMYGLGSVAVFRVARDEFAEHPEAEPSATLVARLLEEHAGPTASRIASAWDLSDRVVTALVQQRDAVYGSSVSPLGRALRFGRVAAALAMLVEAGRMTAPEALAQLPGRRRYPAQVERIWDRLTRGPTVRP